MDSGSITIKLLIIWFLILRVKPFPPNPVDITCQLGEEGGFLRKICTSPKVMGKFYQCFNSNVYYKSLRSNYEKIYIVCPKDPYFYQACGFPEESQSNQEFSSNMKRIYGAKTLCGEYLCVPKDTEILLLFGAYLMETIWCNNVTDCTNTNIDEDGCDEMVEGNDKVELHTGVMIGSNLVCDDRCDAANCEDESFCNGVKYGLYCRGYSGELIYINPRLMCDRFRQCYSGIDERNCEIIKPDFDPNDQFCTSFVNEFPELMALQDRMRCSVVTKSITMDDGCRSYLDQTNCSDTNKVAFTCMVNNYTSTISKYAVCHSSVQTLCDDGLEKSCESVSPGCIIHKHRICDQNPDCPYASDEQPELCSSVTEKTCIRRGRPDIELPVPITWLMDSFMDCTQGEDEIGAIWKTCGSGTAKRFSKEGQLCQDVFLCHEGYVELASLCDGVESCGSENHVCSVSRSFPDIYSKLEVYAIQDTEKIYYMFQCLKGLSSLVLLRGDICIEKTFRYPEHHVFGYTGRSLMMPVKSKKCDHLYGENYVFTSCSNGCEEGQCPLHEEFPHHDTCQSQSFKKVNTYASGKNKNDIPYLSFLTQRAEKYTNEYFSCANKVECVQYSKVCDLVSDCDDSSDEMNCTNHFRCSTYNQLIPKTQKCDGSFNCLDLSDECNDGCSKELLNGLSQKIAAWCLGITSLILNLFALIENIRGAVATSNHQILSNKAYLSLINLGDFMTGVYLISLASMDTYFGIQYCQQQTQWLTDKGCSILGVLSTTGSLISVISMTILSFIRAKTVRNSLRASSTLSKTKLISLILQIFVVILVSTSIAIIPLSPLLEDYFVNGQYYDPSEKLFIGFSNKAEHLEVITRYYGRIRHGSLRWKIINEMIDGMFTKEYGGIKRKKLDFYGNDGTCMFKYFVKSSDPQKEFVWCLLIFHLSCFVIIAASYMAIGVISKNSSQNVGERFRKRHRATQRKITAIIATDCICWVPFIFVCILHSFEVVDGTQWYSLFSVMILPINSVINPILYENMFVSEINSALMKLHTGLKISSRESSKTMMEFGAGRVTRGRGKIGLQDNIRVRDSQANCEEVG